VEIYGFDFTSAPGHGKAITCAGCALQDGTLSVVDVDCFRSFEMFEAFIAQPGPWVAGIDFPFGQPRKLVQDLNWPLSWEGYVRELDATMKPETRKTDFAELLAGYRQGRPRGDKQHLRRVDVLADSRSPMMMYGVPVGRMFIEGAYRLLQSGASIPPCHVVDDPRIILEAYPALAARRWTGGRPYKTDEKRKQTQQRKEAREAIVAGLRREANRYYGLEVEFSEAHAEAFVEDATADGLDALLCAVQAAWAYTKAEENYGIPPDCDPLEGWIVDPQLAWWSLQSGQINRRDAEGAKPCGA
jgi:hypothetical protein